MSDVLATLHRAGVVWQPQRRDLPLLFEAYSSRPCLLLSANDLVMSMEPIALTRCSRFASNQLCTHTQRSLVVLA